MCVFVHRHLPNSFIPSRRSTPVDGRSTPPPCAHSIRILPPASLEASARSVRWLETGRDAGQDALIRRPDQESTIDENDNRRRRRRQT